MKRFNLGLISKNREIIYGITIIWIIFYHATLQFNSSWLAPLMKIKSVGTAGVDVFLFISGISLYFSMAKGTSWGRFYANRLKRLLLPTLLLTVPWFFYRAVVLEGNWHNFWLDASGLSLFTKGDRSVWFVTAILLCYIIYPALHLFFKKYNHSLWTLFIAVYVWILITIFIKIVFNPIFSHAEIMFRRVPIFIIGSFFGKYVYEKKELPFTQRQAVVGTLLFIITYIYAMDQWRNPITSFRYDYIPLAIACTILFSIMGEVKIFKIIFAFFGKITLELYLSHENLLILIPELLPQVSQVVVNILAFLLSIVLSVIVMMIGKLLFRKRPILPPGDQSEAA